MFVTKNISFPTKFSTLYVKIRFPFVRFFLNRFSKKMTLHPLFPHTASLSADDRVKNVVAKSEINHYERCFHELTDADASECIRKWE